MNFKKARPIRAMTLGLSLLATGMVYAQDNLPFTVNEIASFSEPWAIEFLPDGRLLVTEKGGSLQLVTQDGDKTEIGGVPEVDYFFQGGYGDLVLHPDFADNNVVYMSFVEAGDNDTRGAVVATATLDLDNAMLEDVEIIWRAMPKVEGGLHFSHRMVFDDEGHLFVTAGDRNLNAEDPDNAPGQSLDAHLGKIMRLNDDGSAAAGNPFADQGGIAAEVWSMGHRNLLGIAIDPQGRLWNTEMGPRGGDELNLIGAGNNYGYPYVSNGDHYNGKDIPDHDTRPGDFTDPKVWWNPVISPSSLMFYTGDKFPQWNGNAFIGGLSSQSLIRIEIDGDNAIEADRFAMGSRIRAVEQGPDGYLWLLEDGDGGHLLKLTP